MIIVGWQRPLTFLKYQFVEKITDPHTFPTRIIINFTFKTVKVDMVPINYNNFIYEIISKVVKQSKKKVPVSVCRIPNYCN